MRLLVNTASCGLVAMALASPLLFGGCDASKAELQATKTKLAAVTAERDGFKTQLDSAQASLESAKKERDSTVAKLTADAEAAAKRCPEVVAPVEPVAPAKPAPAAPAPAPAGGKKLSPGVKNSSLSAALSEKGPAVQQCAIEHAMDKGAKRVTISVRVTINNKGAVVDSHITANVTDGDSSKVKDCVEAVVRSARFPAISTPLATDERSWTVAAE